jgi:hypothetical protein
MFRALAKRRLRAVALFEFLAGAAGARVVAANFFLSANDLLYWRNVACAGHARLFQFAALAAHEGFFQIVGGCCYQARRVMSVSATSLF